MAIVIVRSACYNLPELAVMSPRHDIAQAHRGKSDNGEVQTVKEAQVVDVTHDDGHETNGK